MRAVGTLWSSAQWTFKKSVREEKVLKEILKERENGIYYSVICDATPDISHVEHNVILLRYIAKKVNNRGR